ncbi:MAG: hypothetical protein EXR86_05720 [Gammaproteobacteria bacterium]|nr:hypothetical protein [Gammaproteobacteria bacterium]
MMRAEALSFIEARGDDAMAFPDWRPAMILANPNAKFFDDADGFVTEPAFALSRWQIKIR